MRRHRVASCAAVLLGLPVFFAQACSTTTPTEPTGPISLTVEYTQPQIPSPVPPPVDLAMCFHHYVPVNLSVTTSWGAQGRLTEVGADTRAYTIRFENVPVDASLWLSIYDIEFCKEGRPLVSRGVRANGTELRTLIETSTGLLAFQFSVSKTGSVAP